MTAAAFNLAYPNNGLDVLAVLFAAAAATLHVRGFVAGLEDKQRRAFELGRTYQQGQMRSIR